MGGESALEPNAVRPVSSTDVERLESFYPEPGRRESRHKHRFGLQERGEGVYLVVWRGDRPAGWVFLHGPGAPESSPRSRQAGAAQIEDLYVVAGWRGQGHGSALLAAVEEVARSHGWSRIGLSVTVANPYNDVARAMYERHGYRDDGGGEYEDGYWYLTDEGDERWDGEPHRFLLKDLAAEAR